jgi:hypothetical protein
LRLSSIRELRRGSTSRGRIECVAMNNTVLGHMPFSPTPHTKQATRSWGTREGGYVGLLLGVLLLRVLLLRVLLLLLLRMKRLGLKLLL